MPDSPPRKPLAPPAGAPRPRARTLDDLDAVRATEAAEELARTAQRELQQARQREAEVLRAKEAAEAAQRAAEERAEEAEQRLSVVAAEPPSTVDEKAIRVRGRGWSLAVPLVAITAIAAPLTAAVKHLVELERQVSETRALVGTFQGQLAKLEEASARQAERAEACRESVARLSGFLAKALPEAGVSVRGAEPGAQDVPLDVERPLRGSPAPRARIKTLVPAPAPL